jgi:hypothetical protein
MRARAAASIQQGRLHLAAIYYAQSGLSFDEVALSLLHCLPESATVVSSTSGGANAATTVVAGSSGKGNTPATTAAASVGASAEATAAHPLSPLVESNLAYFGENVSTTTPTKTGAPAASPAAKNTSGGYNRIAYTSPSLVDTAISKGCALTPLKVFLLQVLRSLPSGAKMQRTMLCTWLCDLYLHQINLARLVGKQAGQGATSSAAAAAGKCYCSDGLWFLSWCNMCSSSPLLKRVGFPALVLKRVCCYKFDVPWCSCKCNTVCTVSIRWVPCSTAVARNLFVPVTYHVLCVHNGRRGVRGDGAQRRPAGGGRAHHAVQELPALQQVRPVCYCYCYCVVLCWT